MTKTVYAYTADGKHLGERTLDDTDRSPISGAWQIPGNMVRCRKHTRILSASPPLRRWRSRKPA